MNRRRAAMAALCLLLGVVIVLSVPYRVWRPTVEAPNYWENHTGGLTPLILQAALGGSFVTIGFAFGFDTIARRLQTLGVRASGVMAVVGGLLGYEPISRTLAGTFGGGGAVYFGVQAGALVLLIVGVAGVLERYPLSGRRGQYGAGVLAGGFSLLAGRDLLSWGLAAVEPQTGALWYSTLGIALIAALAVAVGSVLLGVSLRNRDDAPRWLGLLLAAAGLLSVPLGALVVLQYEAAIGLYGLAWVVVGAHLLVGQPHTVSRFE